MHVHLHQDEGFTVIRGRIGYQRAGEDPKFAGEGESLVFRAGEPHRFWNAGESVLQCRAFIEPAGNAEYLLQALFASQLANGGRRPSLLDIAYLMRRYRSEFVMTEIPNIIQRVFFPPLTLIGVVLGRYHKYADAPHPERPAPASST